MSIICTGSIAYDYLMSFPGYFRDHIMPDKLDSISLSFLVDTMVRQRGGTATNIAYNLSLLGERPRVMATAGEDFPEYRDWLESNHIDTSLVKIIPGVYTASFFVNTDLPTRKLRHFMPVQWRMPASSPCWTCARTFLNWWLSRRMTLAR